MFYSGMTQDGKVILTPEFAASLAQAGLPPPACIEVAHPRGYALDSADRGHQPDEDGALNLALNLAYARLLHGDNADSGANLDETFAGVAPLFNNFEERAQATRGRGTFEGFISADPASEARLFTELKQARGWDRSADDVMRINFALENSYAEQLRGAN